MGEVPFAVYFDFETTSGKKTYDFDEFVDLYPVSYAIAIFHPKMNLDRIFLVRRFNQTFDELNRVGYLSEEILHYFNPVTAR